MAQTDTSEVEQKLRELTQNIDELPSLPGVVTQLLTVLEDPDSSTRDVGKILKQDPSLTAKTFKLINSAYYGLRRRITSVQEAVTYIGFNTIRNLVLATSVMEELSSNEATGMSLNWGNLWKHSVASGIAAETVAEAVQYEQGENAMVCGILHRLGLMILHSHFEPVLTRVLKEKNRSDLSYHEAMKSKLGVKEQDIGLWLGENWDFPRSIRIGIGYHQTPLQPNVDTEYEPLPVIVNLGKNLARQAGYTFELGALSPSFNRDYLDALDLTKQSVKSVFNEYQDNLDNAEEFMKLMEDLAA